MNIKTALLEKKLDYAFKDRELLIQALTHSSFAYESQAEDFSNNEVLEFLGDSILGFIVAEYLCSAYPDLSEGELSKLKSTAASTTALSTFAKKIKLDRNILLGKGEEKSGGRKKKTILAGAFEAVVAAIYLDGSIEPVRSLITGQLDIFFKKIDADKFFINNYKSALQEHLQKENYPAPVYKTITTMGPDHKKRFVVEVSSRNEKLAKAKGLSKKDAEQKAAQKALKTLMGRKLKTLTSDTFLVKRKKD